MTLFKVPLHSRNEKKKGKKKKSVSHNCFINFPLKRKNT